jgi:hypothetical protein
MNANAVKFALTVNNGSGSGYYIHNETLNIIANDAPAGYRFKEWVINSGNPFITNKNSMNTLLKMTGGETEVTATFEFTANYLDDCDDKSGWNDANSISLINSSHKQGKGCLEYYGGGEGESSREFYKSFSNPYNSRVNESNAVLQFWYYISDISKIGSSNQIELGSGGNNDVDEYNWKLNGRVSNGWNLLNLKMSEAGKMGNPNLSAINWFRLYDKKSGPVTSRIDGIKILNISDVNKYTLLVNGGAGSGIYNPGEQITITANAALEGTEFVTWIVNSGGVVISNNTSPTTIITMPDIDVYVSANYTEIQNGINNSLSNEKPVVIYPNPSNGQFNIVFPDNFDQTKYEIYNIIGRLIKTGYLYDNLTSFDLNGSSKGTYILRLISEARVYIERLIIQ